MRNNPFCLDFGSTPNLFIPRYSEINTIVNTFCSEIPSSHIFMILGARGSGKTVLMGAVKEELTKETGWVHVDISPESDMMNVFAATLYQKCKRKLTKLSLSVNIDIKVASIGAIPEYESRYSNVYTDLDAMLERLREKEVKVLITVDEAMNSKAVREFTSYFQHCLREKYPVFLLMTGLYKNIKALQNDRSQTFLKRTPKILLKSLNEARIAQKYKEVFSLSEEDAEKMASYTKGYSYAFQILGFLVFESNRRTVSEKLLEEYKLILAESSYDKIWEELSNNERNVAWAAAQEQDTVRVKDLREKLQMNSNEFSTYCDTLEKSGVFSSKSAYGRVQFALPYIKDYIKKLCI